MQATDGRASSNGGDTIGSPSSKGGASSKGDICDDAAQGDKLQPQHGEAMGDGTGRCTNDERDPHPVDCYVTSAYTKG